MDSNAVRHFGRALRNAVIDLRTIRDTPSTEGAKKQVDALKQLAARSIRELMSELEVETESQLCDLLNVNR